VNGEREKSKYQIKNTVYRVFCRDNQYGKEYGQKCDEVKCTHGCICNTFTPKKGRGKGIKVLY
jgi:hypothetical protein